MLSSGSLPRTQVATAPIAADWALGTAFPLPHGGFEVYAPLCTTGGQWRSIAAPTLALTTPSNAAAAPDTALARAWSFSATTAAGSAGVQYGCTFSSAPCSSPYQPAAPWGGVPAYEGSVYGFFSGAASMQITVTGLSPGDSYNLSWAMTAMPTTAVFANAIFSASGDGNDLSVVARCCGMLPPAKDPPVLPPLLCILMSCFSSNSAFFFFFFFCECVCA